MDIENKPLSERKIRSLSKRVIKGDQPYLIMQIIKNDDGSEGVQTYSPSTLEDQLQLIEWTLCTMKARKLINTGIMNAIAKRVCKYKEKD